MHDNKTMALAEHLGVSPELIKNDYSHYYTVNERKVKEGHDPEYYKDTAAKFKSLLDDKHIELIKKAIKAKDVLSKEYRDVVYHTVEEYLRPLIEKAQKAKKKLETLGELQGRVTDKQVATVLELQKEHLYLVNPLYWFLNFDEKYGTDHAEQMQNAFIGAPVDDIRKDTTRNDGEYLVLTDSEADEWEEEGLRNLFQEMTYEVQDTFIRNYLDEDKFVEDQSGNRGENINGYDGTEEEVKYDGETFYIYRHN